MEERTAGTFRIVYSEIINFVGSNDGLITHNGTNRTKRCLSLNCEPTIESYQFTKSS